MTNYRCNELFDFIEQEGIATENEIMLVVNINGYSEETLNDIIWARTGYHSKEQYEDCELNFEE